ncbi:MAG TPA: DUF5916 domain-containing protein, partial [Paludibacter sp.]
TKHPSTDQVANYGDLQGSLRLGQRFQIDYALSFNNTINGVGFVDKNSTNDSIIFAKRNVNILENILSTSYVLNNKTSISLRVRHNWAGDRNKIYYLLQHDGSLQDYPTYNKNMDQNYNAFTVDMIFRWNFAPGSELVMAWKNAAYAIQDVVVDSYWNNLRDTWLNQSNSLSIKVLYYIDYNNLKKKKK